LSAQAGFAVVMGKQNAAVSLTPKQVSDIYLGLKKSLPGGELVSTAIVDKGDSTDLFLRSVMQKDRAQAEARWAMLEFTGRGTAPTEVPDDDAMKKLVTSTNGMIGVIDADSVDETVTVILKHP
jgi:ABC-type phosphate transport system substrate-binding protein